MSQTNQMTPSQKKRLSRQAEMVLELLLDGAKLTQQDAFSWGVERLGARIYDLRKAGIPVQSEFVIVRKKTGGRARVKCYWLDRWQRGVILQERRRFRCGKNTTEKQATQMTPKRDSSAKAKSNSLFDTTPVGYD